MALIFETSMRITEAASEQNRNRVVKFVKLPVRTTMRAYINVWNQAIATVQTETVANLLYL